MIVRNEGAGEAGDVKPRVVVKGKARQLGGRERRRRQNRLDHRAEHESAQLLDTRVGPPEQIEPALEQLLLRDVAG